MKIYSPLLIVVALVALAACDQRANPKYTGPITDQICGVPFANNAQLYDALMDQNLPQTQDAEFVMVIDQQNKRQFTFTKNEHKAYPAVLCSYLEKDAASGAAYVKIQMKCAAEPTQCKKLLERFEKQAAAQAKPAAKKKK